MSDPQPDRLKPRPRRGEPLQPDKPSRGTDPLRTPADDHADTARRDDAARERKEQSDTASENTREGYD